MNKQGVLKWLQDNQDPRGIKHWEAGGLSSTGLRSYGIGLTRLRKLAKSIGRDATLATELWQSDVYEARVVALLVDDPKTITREQAEQQVEQVQAGQLAHVFSSCDATLAKAPFAKELADDWILSDDSVRRGCAYGLLYELSKSKKKTAPGDDYFLAQVQHIGRNWEREGVDTLCAMGGALLGIGKRSKELHAAALEVARAIGPIVFDPTGKCDPMDIEKNLMSDYVRSKLGV